MLAHSLFDSAVWLGTFAVDRVVQLHVWVRGVQQLRIDALALCHEKTAALAHWSGKA